jgi:hypothetical protein
MSKTTSTQAASGYDPRWFIWTIVFLIVAGFSLVSYITIVGYNDANTVVDFSTTHVTSHR